MLLNGKPLDALAFVTQRDQAQAEGRRVCLKLHKTIKRQQFEVVIQAAIGSKVCIPSLFAAFIQVCTNERRDYCVRRSSRASASRRFGKTCSRSLERQSASGTSREK